MAIITIPRPPMNALPTSSWLRPRTTVSPRPPDPTSAAMTTIERASMITWLTPAMIVGRACGSSTLRSVCQGVAPKAWAASTVFCGTCLMPSNVSLTAGGAAKMTVATSAGPAPRPKNTTMGTNPTPGGEVRAATHPPTKTADSVLHHIEEVVDNLDVLHVVDEALGPIVERDLRDEVLLQESEHP